MKKMMDKFQDALIFAVAYIVLDLLRHGAEDIGIILLSGVIAGILYGLLRPVIRKGIDRIWPTTEKN